MQTLQWFFLESTAALGAVLFVALFWLLVYWRRSGNVRPLLVGLGLAIILLVTQGLVTTQREHADRILERIEKDVRQGRSTALAEVLAPQFTSVGLNREQFLALVNERLQHITIRWLHRTALELEPEGNGFVARAGYLAEISFDNDAGGFGSQWTFHFASADGQWRITAIDLPRIANRTFNSWSDVRP